MPTEDAGGTFEIATRIAHNFLTVWVCNSALLPVWILMARNRSFDKYRNYYAALSARDVLIRAHFVS